jgi:glycosyltransferase involved in cell wall biosynthesis
VEQDIMIVNIAMPVYNTNVLWLKEAIQSIQSQTYKHWKLIVVDDCSTNLETIKFLESIVSQNIQLVRTEQNLGCDSARLFAKKFLDKDCELLIFMDSDDIMMPNRIEKQIAFLDTNKDVGIVGGQMQMFVDRTSPFIDMNTPDCEGVTSHPYNVNQYILSKSWVINNPSTAMRRSVVDEFDAGLIRKIQDELGLDRNVYGDLIFYSINAMIGVQIRNLSDIIIFYRVSKHNLSGKSWYQNKEKHKQLRKKILEYYVSK